MRITPFVEFRNGFLPYVILTVSEGLLLCTFTLQARGSTFGNAACACSLASGYIIKHNVINKRSCIDGINKRENLMTLFKV